MGKKKIVVCDLPENKRMIFLQDDSSNQKNKAEMPPLNDICKLCDAYSICGGSAIGV